MLLGSASPPSLEVTDDYMRTPLIGASINGHYKIIDMLLQHRPKVPHKEMNDALEMATDCAKRKLEKKHKNCEKGLELIWKHIQLTGKREL
jgi:ankyrin repeat protein